MNPVAASSIIQVLQAARSLKQATLAAGINREVLYMHTEDVINDRLPVVCEFFCLVDLFPEADSAADLAQALLRCSQAVCNSLQEACIAVYKFLQCSESVTWSQLAGVEECVGEKSRHVRMCLDDVIPCKSVAASLRDQQSKEQAQNTSALKRMIWLTLRRVSFNASRSHVKAVGTAALARQEPGGQVIYVSLASVNAVAVSASGENFATGGGLGSGVGACAAAVWDVATGTRLHDLQGHTRDIVSIAWSPDCRRVATGSWDKTAIVWDATTGTRVHELLGHSDCVRCVAWSPDGTRVATASHDNTVAVWDADTGARVLEVCGHKDSVRSVAWSPDGSRLVTGSDDATAAVWDAVSCNRVHELQRHRGPVTSVAWSPDGTLVATGSRDDTASLWDAATGVHMHELRMHSDDVESLAWSPDGSKLATASMDKTSAVWTRSGIFVHRLTGHSITVRSIAWSPYGALVFTSSGDGSVRIYSLLGRDA